MLVFKDVKPSFSSRYITYFVKCWCQKTIISLSGVHMADKNVFSWRRKVVVGRQSIDNSCRRAHSSKPVAAGLSQQLWANAGTDRRTQDIVSLHRPCSAYSTQEAVPVIQTCLYRAPRGIFIGNIGLVYRRAFLLPAVWMSETAWVERRTESTELPSALLAV